jgi:hypothetical protein
MFCGIGLFNEADTLESSSTLIYYSQQQSILYTTGWCKAILIETVEIKEKQLRWCVIN